jgi:hypothetical protein
VARITLGAATGVNAVVNKLQFAPKKQQSEDRNALAASKIKFAKEGSDNRFTSLMISSLSWKW